MFEKFLNSVISHFPREITINRGNSDSSDLLLQRRVLVIDGCDNAVSYDSKFLDHIFLKTVDPKGIENMLNLFLDILADNLGKKYERASKEMYENNRPWTENKMEEMNSEGLVYVSYWDDNQPLVYLSFMLTEEEGLCIDNADSMSSVVFLYEIQLLEPVRRRGLGKRLIGDYLKECCSYFAYSHGSELEHPFVGIELTVFSDNSAALALYHSLGMEKTPNSPVDKSLNLRPRTITRTSANRLNRSPTEGQIKRTMIKKPLYYLYLMRIDDFNPNMNKEST
ncbi:N-alpha-acetyltransferase 40 [Nakaseomyces bracarensis]|uniref:N-alpha-acetyltransferase 40 n=1 Tax=Nakaseomyces bracarensis TaxID=273131 RepID=A0ABR4NMZ9_9SACH